MASSDWISLIQAGLLAVAGFYSYRGFRLSLVEHREARVASRREPERQLMLAVITELKYLAVARLEADDAKGFARVRAQQFRVRVAIETVDVAERAACYALVNAAPMALQESQILDAFAEMKWNLMALERGYLDNNSRLSYREGDGDGIGDLPPLPAPSEAA